MSDTEEVIITRKPKAVKDTKPEIAREKLKEKRERLKKEKESLLIEEAKKKLKAEAEEEKKKVIEEEEKKKQDPIFMLNQKLDSILTKFTTINGQEHEISTEEVKKLKKKLDKVEAPKKAKAKKEKEIILPPVGRKKRIVTESEDEGESIVIPKIPKTKKAVAPRRKVYVEDSPSNNFVGRPVIAPPNTPVERPPTSVLAGMLGARRRLNTYST